MSTCESVLGKQCLDVGGVGIRDSGEFQQGLASSTIVFGDGALADFTSERVETVTGFLVEGQSTSRTESRPLADRCPTLITLFDIGRLRDVAISEVVMLEDGFVHLLVIYGTVPREHVTVLSVETADV